MCLSLKWKLFTINPPIVALCAECVSKPCTYNCHSHSIILLFCCSQLTCVKTVIRTRSVSIIHASVIQDTKATDFIVNVSLP